MMKEAGKIERVPPTKIETKSKVIRNNKREGEKYIIYSSVRRRCFVSILNATEINKHTYFFL